MTTIGTATTLGRKSVVQTLGGAPHVSNRRLSLSKRPTYFGLRRISGDLWQHAASSLAPRAVNKGKHSCVSVCCASNAAKYDHSVHAEVVQTDFVVVGSGIAGLSYALRVADHGKVAIVTKDVAHEGSTRYAQGGICAVLDASDSVESHISDTVVAGDFLCDLRAVKMVCSEGAAAVLELVDMGAEFTRSSSGDLHLTREGGHEHKRIVHAADMTGREIERVLVEKALAHPNIQFYENHFATDLVTVQEGDATRCVGIDVVERATNKDIRFVSAVTMLASGGAGHIYPNTTNPVVATGDGIAIAARAKAHIANMEFMQFHPTSLYVEPDENAAVSRESVFLITEAVRGEGGLLYNAAGERFMPKYDSRLELAPRDVVARSIDDQLKKYGDKCVYLDITHKPAEEIMEHFPNIAAHLQHSLGLDITKDRIPVVPAMHYTCGGVKTGLKGDTSLPGLYATGEVAYTGLHGANRLASNSLLEGLVYSIKAASASTKYVETNARQSTSLFENAAEEFYSREVSIPPEDPKAVKYALNVLMNLRRKLQATMWENAGIVRSNTRLLDAMEQVKRLRMELEAISAEVDIHSLATIDCELKVEHFELLNLFTVSELVVVSAMMRKESRGLHFTTDYPYKVEGERRPTVINTPLKSARKKIRRKLTLNRSGIGRELAQ
ncbi:hypothetical protein CYMTET_7550 [Cymbomonas tetramitiformis]|uniref:L-aspartate oxidase n=1 Tax=Cymbomonas tetramitiformis TaxID=36881 RepID=A0AAE0GUX7_9CHLO|nr:hypothetical protein CYMTET_7550 [Cymbomonas tetramitiformis]